MNPELSRFDLWKQTAAWWFLEGEAFWFFGSDYRGGIPKELFVLDPRRMSQMAENGKIRKWFYSSNAGYAAILPDETARLPERETNDIEISFRLENTFPEPGRTSWTMGYRDLPAG